jgi:hypothetical protein
VKDFFRPEGPVLSAQAESLGMRAKEAFDPERVIHILAVQARERPYQGRCPGDDHSQAFGLG